ncbi:hypothetical protein ACFQJ7_13840 [Halovenus rubra]|uniref:Uncharacterized protein n=2 Tax=Halovenus rubra TaxID=869890 RepID=A0ABD5X7A1_9EURY|nr:hypothetical protein [Halovenus rubra]
MTEETATDDEREPIFEPRERALITASASIALVVGLWLGHWLVPSEAFAEHITHNATYTEGVDAYYQPTNRLLPLFSVFILALGGYWSYRGFVEADEEVAES